MELRQLEYLTAVARHGHFRRAAEELYVTQSALSQQIRRLEDELGLALLVRTPGGVTLTPAGAEFVTRIEHILAEVANARAQIDQHRGAVKGVARVAATVADAQRLPAALASFHRRYPGVQITLRHTSARDVTALLASHAVDVALLGVHDSSPQLPPGVRQHAISGEALRLVCAPDDDRVGRNDLTIETLRGAPVILAERGTALRQLVMSACMEAGFSPIPLLETGDPSTVRHLAAAGIGLSAVPAPWLDEAREEIGVADFARPLQHRLALLSNAENELPAGRLLREHLESALQDRSWR